MLGFGMVAREFIVLAITEKWLASAFLLQILCVSGAIIPMSQLMSSLVVSNGKSGTYFGVTFALGVVQILTMILIWHWGIRTMVIAYVLLNIIWLFVWQYFSRRLIGYRVWMFLKDILPFALAALAGDDSYLFRHAVYPQSVAAPALPHSDGCCAVLSGDAYCRCCHPEGVYGFREEENGKEVTLMGSDESS